MKTDKEIKGKMTARRDVEPPPKERVELLMEQVLDKVDALGEGQVSLIKKVNALGESHAALQVKVDGLDVKLSALGESHAALQVKVDGLDGKMSALGESHAVLQAKADRMDVRADAHECKMDARFAETNAKIDVVARDLKEHRADTAAHLTVH